MRAPHCDPGLFGNCINNGGEHEPLHNGHDMIMNPRPDDVNRSLVANDALAHADDVESGGALASRDDAKRWWLSPNDRGLAPQYDNRRCSLRCCWEEIK